MADVIIRVVHEGQTHDLDIDNNIPLRLDVSAIENGSIGRFFGVGSQTFDLPGTKRNNRFFKHAYEIGTEDIPAFADTIPGYVIYDGETLVQGQFQMFEAVATPDGVVSYKCQITDSVVQFNDGISTKLIRNADWSAYTHTLTSGSVIDSWSDNLLGGSVYYPLVNQGLENTDDFPSLPRFQLGSNNGDLGSSATPLQVKQLLPAIKAKDVLEVIFDQVGYTATGSFMESVDFNKVYILPKSKDTLGAGTPQFNGLDASDNSVMSSMTSGIYYPLNFVGPVDPGNNFNPATDTYTVPVDGKYTMSAIYDATANPVNPGNSPVTFNLTFEINGTPQVPGVSQQLVTGGPTPSMALPAEEFTFTAGDTIRLVLKATYGGTTLNSFPYSAGWSIPNSSAPTTFEGTTVNMSEQWDAETKSVDVLKGFIEQFNLVLTPEYGTNNVIRVETFNTWMSQGREVDWTNKYNTSERISVNHTRSEQQREMRFSNVDDADRFSRLAIDSAPNFQYGTQRTISDSKVPQGSRRVGSFFGPTVLGSEFVSGSVDADNNPTYNIQLASTFVYPHLYKFENRETKSYKFAPRIGYKVDNALPSNIFIGLPLNSTEVSGLYSTLSNLSQLPAVTGSTDDLHFNNTYTPLIASNLNPQQGTTAFTTYWKTYVDSLYWEGSRKLTIDLEFKQQEYKDIRLNDKIFIKDQLYRINKISGFNVSNKDVSTVELIRLYPELYSGSTAPTPVPVPVPVPSVPTPEVPTPVPSVPTPEVPTPSVPTPEVPTPEVPTPVPSVPTPEVPTPSVPTPEVPTPSIPTPTPPDNVFGVERLSDGFSTYAQLNPTYGVTDLVVLSNDPGECYEIMFEDYVLDPSIYPTITSLCPPTPVPVPVPVPSVPTPSTAFYAEYKDCGDPTAPSTYFYRTVNTWKAVIDFGGVCVEFIQTVGGQGTAYDYDLYTKYDSCGECQGIPTPSVPTPSVPTPSVPTPEVPTPVPSVPTPSVPTPSVPTPTPADNAFGVERVSDGFSTYAQLNGSYSVTDIVVLSNDPGECYEIMFEDYVLDPSIYPTITSLCPPTPVPSVPTPVPSVSCNLNVIYATATDPSLGGAGLTALCSGPNRNVYLNTNDLDTATVSYGTSSDCSTPQAGTRYYAKPGATQYYIWNGAAMTGPFTLNCP